MQAPPGVPTTLYVVAKTAGATANGITGAEFRVEFANPTGYILNYTPPPASAIVIGNPLDGTGFNIGFPTCRNPVGGTVQLGTIFVFNTGAGGQTAITVKRRNPPLNSSYQCALFTLCDSTFSLSCMTAPADSSCLMEKAGLQLVLQSDEFSTSLDGSSETETSAGSDYVGLRVRSAGECAGYERVTCTIEKKDPTCGVQIEAWVGISHQGERNQAGEKIVTRYLQTGWHKTSTDPDVTMYWETRNAPFSSGIVEMGPPPLGATTYRVRKTGSAVVLEAPGLWITDEFTWASFSPEEEPLVSAQFSAELHGGSAVDYTPGAPLYPCFFSNASVRVWGESGDEEAKFDSRGRLMQDPLPANAGLDGKTATSFYIYDTRHSTPQQIYDTR